MKYKVRVVYKWWFIFTRVLELKNIPRNVTRVIENMCIGDIFHLQDGSGQHFYINSANIIYIQWIGEDDTSYINKLKR